VIPGPVVRSWLATLDRLVLAAVFVAAGWPKFLDTEGTVRSVRAFRLLPEALVRPFAYGLPLLELVLAVLLLAGLTTRWAAAVAAGLLAVFLFGIAAAWARGLSIDCGCFGGGGNTVADPVPGYLADLGRDGVLLLLAAALVAWPASRLSADGALGLTPTSRDASPGADLTGKAAQR
jgi:uncharacterized membrane protein YphA (DoxX/SURF4 family)